MLPHLFLRSLPEYVQRLFDNSTFAVMFFFMLSGFVLTWSSRPHDTKTAFYRRRFARIYPLHFTTLLLSIPVWYLERGGGSLKWAALPFSLTLTQAWMPIYTYYNAFNTLSWSLSCEAFFYLCFPFMLAFLQRRSRMVRRLLLLLGVLSIAGKGIAVAALTINQGHAAGPLSWHDLAHWGGYYFPVVRIVDFVVGILLALEIREGFRSRVRPAVAIAVTFACALLIALRPFDLGTVDAFMAAPAMLLLSSAATRDLSESPPPLRLFVVLGEASFSMYMVQQLLTRLVIALAPTLFLGPPILALLLAAVTIVAISIISLPVHRYFEVSLERRLRPPRSRQPVQELSA